MSSFHFVNKTAESRNLSRPEDGDERTGVYRHVARRTSDQRITTLSRGTRRLVPQLPRSPGENRLVYGQGLLEAFIDHSTHALMTQEDHLDIHCFFWLKKLSTRLHSLAEPALRSSIVALAAAGLGQAMKDQDLIQNGTLAYEETVEMLSGTHVSSDDQAFAACLTLIMYQYFAATPNRQHLYVHIGGLAAMLQSRGPESFQEGLAHDLFTSCRSVLISSSLNSRKALFIASDEWMTTPWQTKAKSSYENILDCMSLIPHIGQDFDDVHQQQRQRHGLDVSQRKHLALLLALWQAVSTLHERFLTIVDRARPTGLVHTHDPCLLDPAPLILTFPRSYQYQSLATSGICRNFWVGLTDMYNMLALTYESLAEHGIYDVPLDPVLQRCQACIGGDPGGGHHNHYFCTAGAADSNTRPLPSLNAESCNSVALGFACRTFARTAAEQVCMSLQYAISPQHGIVGKYISIIPLKFAIWCFTINLPSTDHQLQWARRVVKMLAESGVPFSAKLFCDKPYRQMRDFGEGQ